MDEVASNGTTIVITKRGQPVARLLSMEGARPSALGCLAGAVDVIDEDFALPEWQVSPKKAKR